MTSKRKNLSITWQISQTSKIFSEFLLMIAFYQLSVFSVSKTFWRCPWTRILAYLTIRLIWLHMQEWVKDFFSYSCWDEINLATFSFQRHLKSNDKNQLECPVCSKILPSQASLRRHMNTAHRESKTKASSKRIVQQPQNNTCICNVENCNRSFQNQKKLQKHLKKDHRDLFEQADNIERELKKQNQVKNKWVSLAYFLVVSSLVLALYVLL